MEHFQELQRDIAPFADLNDRATATGALEPSERAALLAMAPVIVRKHIDFFAAFFVTSLTELDSGLRLQASNGSFEYAFRDKDEAANAAEMAVRQVLDERVAASISLLLLLAFLKRSNRNAGLTTEEAQAAIRTVARLAHEYRMGLAQAFVQEGLSLQRRDAQRKWAGRAAVVIVGLVAGWYLFKR